MTTQSSTNRIVAYKGCRYHSAEFARRVDDREADCTDCRRATFRASMRARGISVTVPRYTGGWSHQGNNGGLLLRDPAIQKWYQRMTERQTTEQNPA